MNVFVQASLHSEYKNKKPGQYMSVMLNELVPEGVQVLPGVTAKGSRLPRTVGLPSDLYKALKSNV